MKIPVRQYWQLLARYVRPQGRRVGVLAVVLLGSIALQVLNPQVIRVFIDTAEAGGAEGALLAAAALFVGMAVVQQVLNIAATYVSEQVGWTATNELRSDLADHTLRLDIGFHKERTPGELIERIDGDVTALANFFSRFVIYVLGNGLLLLGVLVLLAAENWLVGGALALFSALALSVLLRIRHLAVPHWAADREASAGFFGFLGEQLQGTEDIRSSGSTAHSMRRFHEHLRGWLPVVKRAGMAGSSMWIATITIFALGDAVAFALGAYLFFRGEISLGSAYVIFYYTALLVRPIEQIRNQMEDLQKADASIGRVRELLATESRLPDGRGAPLPPGALSVEFDRVTFGYERDEPVLRDLPLELAPGETLGLLGHTGSGKTTIARLFFRLYDPQEGEIRLGGVPLREPRLAELRRRVGMVTQDVQLFAASVRDNLAFFDGSIPDARIAAVIEELGLGPWLRSLPDGLDTELAAGGGLSAGEAQLLAFGRLFLSDPGLVILDEASSRLDPATEALLERAMDRLLAGRTGIVIAHRLATVQRVDRILILEAGRVMEQGLRRELAADPGSRFSGLLRAGLEEVLV